MNEFATRCNVYVFAVCLHVVFNSSGKIAIFNLSSPTRVCRQFQKQQLPVAVTNMLYA